MSDYQYYRFPVGEVILRRKGNIIEKKGKNGVWENASDQMWRFASGDLSLIPIDDPEPLAEEMPAEDSLAEHLYKNKSLNVTI